MLRRIAIAAFVLSTATQGAEIEGPSSVRSGEIAVFTANIAEDSRFRWILPPGIEPDLENGRQIALIPGDEMSIEIILVEVTADEIKIARHTLFVGDSDRKPSAEDIVDQSARGPPASADASVIMYSLTNCEPCERWIREEYPKLPESLKSRFEKRIDSEGVTAFPSFKLSAYRQERFFQGYLSADQISEQLEQMENRAQ